MTGVDLIRMDGIYAPAALCIIADIINSATKYRNNRHSGESRNPDGCWIPDHVRDDKGWSI